MVFSRAPAERSSSTSSSSIVFVISDNGGSLLEQSFVRIGDGDVGAFEFLQNIFDVVGRDDVVRQLAIQIVESQVFLVAAQLEQALHYIVTIFVVVSHRLTPQLQTPDSRKSSQQLTLNPSVAFGVSDLALRFKTFSTAVQLTIFHDQCHPPIVLAIAFCRGNLVALSSRIRRSIFYQPQGVEAFLHGKSHILQVFIFRRDGANE